MDFLIIFILYIFKYKSLNWTFSQSVSFFKNIVSYRLMQISTVSYLKKSKKYQLNLNSCKYQVLIIEIKVFHISRQI